MRKGDVASTASEAGRFFPIAPVAAPAVVIGALVVLMQFVESRWLTLGAGAAALAATCACGWIVARRAKAIEAFLSLSSKAGVSEISAETASLLGERLTGIAKSQAEATRERDFLRDALFRSGVPALLCDKQDKVRGFTETFAEFTGQRPSIGGDVSLRSVVGDDLPSNFDKAVYPEGHVAEIKAADGQTVRARCLCVSLGAEGGRMVQLIPLAQKRKSLEDAEKQRALIVSTAKSLCALAQRLTEASETLKSSAEKQVGGAKRQKSQTDSVAVAMEEMTASVIEVARNAAATSEAASEARSVAKEGGAMVKNTVEGIASVAASASELAESLTTLERQSAEIGRIMQVIDDIADQTNLLALNAAIEAARAGDAGRGFAVVADEVRKLAEKTMTATKEVAKSVQAIQGSTRNAVTSMTRTSQKVEESTQLSSRTGASLDRILSRVEDVVERTTQIATAAEEQSATSEEISRHVQEVAGIATQFSDGASREAMAVEGLLVLSHELFEVARSMSTDGVCVMGPGK